MKSYFLFPIATVVLKIYSIDFQSFFIFCESEISWQNVIWCYFDGAWCAAFAVKRFKSLKIVVKVGVLVYWKWLDASMERQHKYVYGVQRSKLVIKAARLDRCKVLRLKVYRWTLTAILGLVWFWNKIQSILVILVWSVANMLQWLWYQILI